MSDKVIKTCIFAFAVCILVIIGYYKITQPVECGYHPDEEEPWLEITFQPYDDFTIEEAEKLKQNLIVKLNETYGDFAPSITIEQPKQLPETSYYAPRKRYLADEILKDLWPDYNPGTDPTYIFGLTHKDISYKIHGHENYGIQGLTSLGTHKSIVSDYRTKDLVAVMVHEFGHGYFGAKHCNDTKCIMCDFQKLKGKSYQYKLCKKHKSLNCDNVE